MEGEFDHVRINASRFFGCCGCCNGGAMLTSEVVNAQSALGNTNVEFGRADEVDGVDTGKLGDLNTLFERQIKDGIHPGAQLYVRVKDKTVFNRFGGFAITPSTRMKHDTKNLLFSATNPMGTAATMMLVEQGYLKLDKPLVHYWPTFVRGGAGKKDVTVRHVLGHQSGFPSGPKDFNYEHFDNPAEAMKPMERVEPSFEPGSKFQYHPINYGWALGELIRRTSGMSVERFVKENLFDPLGCINASIGVPADELNEISYLYRVNDRSHTIEIWNSPSVRMASSGHAPAENLARFYTMIAKDGATDTGEQLLKQETVALMTKEQPIQKTGKPSGYGLGFFIDYDDEDTKDGYTFGHGGSSSSFGRHDPTLNLSVGFITNGHQVPEVQTKRMKDIWKTCRALAV